MHIYIKILKNSQYFFYEKDLHIEIINLVKKHAR